MLWGIGKEVILCMTPSELDTVFLFLDHEQASTFWESDKRCSNSPSLLQAELESSMFLAKTYLEFKITLISILVSMEIIVNWR